MSKDLSAYINKRKQVLEKAKKQYEELTRTPGKESEAFDLLMRILKYINATLKEIVTSLPEPEVDDAKKHTESSTPKLVVIPKNHRIH